MNSVIQAQIIALLNSETVFPSEMHQQCLDVIEMVRATDGDDAALALAEWYRDKLFEYFPDFKKQRQKESN